MADNDSHIKLVGGRERVATRNNKVSPSILGSKHNKKQPPSPLETQLGGLMEGWEGQRERLKVALPPSYLNLTENCGAGDGRELVMVL